MKAIFFLLFLSPFLSLAQESKKPAPAQKPSTTDCPTWTSKPSQSKAAYYESLRHTRKPAGDSLAAKKKVSSSKPKAKKDYTPSFNSGDDKVMEKKKPATEDKAPVKKKAQKG